jgi:hypothetical protein
VPSFLLKKGFNPTCRALVGVYAGDRRGRPTYSSQGERLGQNIFKYNSTPVTNRQDGCSDKENAKENAKEKAGERRIHYVLFVLLLGI